MHRIRSFALCANSSTRFSLRFHSLCINHPNTDVHSSTPYLVNLDLLTPLSLASLMHPLLSINEAHTVSLFLNPLAIGKTKWNTGTLRNEENGFHYSHTRVSARQIMEQMESVCALFSLFLCFCKFVTTVTTHTLSFPS